MKSKKSFINLAKVPFSRRGSYLTVLNKQDGDDIDRGKEDELYLSRTWNNSCIIKRADQIRIALVYDGKEEPYEYTATSSLLRLEAQHGWVEICIDDTQMFRIRGQGVTFNCYSVMWGHEGSVDREDGTWEVSFSMIGKFLFVPIKGEMTAKGGLNWKWQTPDPVSIDFFSSNGEIFEGAIQWSTTNGRKEDNYKDFDTIVRETDKDFREWSNKYPKVADEFKETREKAVYVVWSHVMSPLGQLKNEMVYMSRNALADAFGWQQGYQAMAVISDVKKAWDFLCNMFEYQLPDGQLPDWLNDCSGTYLTCKPPFQGLAFDWLWNHADMSQLTVSDYEKLYEPMKKWASWWFDFRDTDHDGIPQYSHPDESGWDDGSIFSKGVPVESPDLAAFLVLICDSLWKMAEKIGRNADAIYWKSRSKKLLSDMIDEFWDEEHFVAKLSGSHEIVGGCCVALYQPIILGKRLPDDIIEKLVRDLSDESGYLCQHGIASEHPDSPLFEPLNGFCRGVVVSPVQLMMAVGAKEAGAEKLAQTITRRFCEKVARDGFSLCHFPYDSPDMIVRPSERDLNYVNDMTLDTSWTAAIFLTLAGFIMDK